MASKTITLKVIDASEKETNLKVKPDSGNQALRLQATAGNKYIISDETTQFAPQEINVQKSGRDLLISFSANADADIVIEKYFDTIVGKDSLLFGQDKNGQYHPFVPSSGLHSEAIYMLPEYTVTSQVLSEESVNLAISSTETTVAATPKTLFIAGAGILGVVAIAALASSGGKDNNDQQSHKNQQADDPPNTPKIDISHIMKAEKPLEQFIGLNKDEIKKEEIVFEMHPGHEDENFGGFWNHTFQIDGFHRGNFYTDPDADRIVLKDIIIGDITADSPISELEQYFKLVGYKNHDGSPGYDDREESYVLVIDADGPGTKFTPNYLYYHPAPDDPDYKYEWETVSPHFKIFDCGPGMKDGGTSIAELVENGQLIWF